MTKSATAPAQHIDISDPLDQNLDWDSFELTEIGFGDLRLPMPPHLQHYETVVNMSVGGRSIDVQVEAGIRADTGKVYATFQTIDPDTELPPDVTVGFLPPEDGTGRGQGFVSYIVRPKANLPTGAQIRNVAGITFDFADTITTDQVDPHDPTKGTDPNKQCLNTIDAGTPTSEIVPLPVHETSPSFRVTWIGVDDLGGSGIASYDVFVSDNDGAFVLWQAATTDTSATFAGQAEHAYVFYSVATDHVGQRQHAPFPLAATIVAVNPWHNYEKRCDVDGNGSVAPLDVLTLINYVNSHPGGTALPSVPEKPPRYYDVDDKGEVTPLDVLMVINHINALPSGGEAALSAADEASALGAMQTLQKAGRVAVGAGPFLSAGTVPASAPYRRQDPPAVDGLGLLVTIVPGVANPPRPVQAD